MRFITSSALKHAQSLGHRAWAILLSVTLAGAAFVTQALADGPERGLHDHPASDEWIMLAVIGLVFVGVTVFAIRAQRRARNPFTGLPGRIRGRRFRGPARGR